MLRKIEARDNVAVAAIIREVMTEYGACGPGFSINDPEVDHMFEAYQQSGHAYFVLELDHRLLGGAGIGPLTGQSAGICELRKMYFLSGIRGKGWGRQMLELCLQTAVDMGYQACYLESLNTMTEAAKLYQRAGFEPLAHQMGNTGHSACDSYYLLKL